MRMQLGPGPGYYWACSWSSRRGRDTGGGEKESSCGASWSFSVGERQFQGALLEVGKRAQRTHFDVDGSPFCVDVSQQVNSSGFVGVIHDCEVLLSAGAHVGKDVLYDLPLARVSLLGGGDFGANGHFDLL